MILGSGLIQSSGWTPTWLIRDEFTDTLAAGSVNGTAATPGPGTRSVTDTGNLVSVGSGVLTTVAPASPGIDPRTLYGAITRTTGLCLVARYNSVSGNDQGAAFYSGAATSVGNGIGIRQISGDIIVRAAAGSSISTISLDGTAYELCVVARSTGAIMLARKSGDATWKLLWIDNAGAWATVYPGVANYQASYSIDYLRVLQLPAPFDNDDGLATDVLSGSVSAGTTFSHEADCLIEFTVTTLPSAGTVDAYFRAQDANNAWIARVTDSGAFALVERISGSGVNRAITGVGTILNGHRIVVIADGTTIKGYSNNVLRWTYSSATNFATATVGELNSLGTGGAVSDLKAYPYGGSLALATYSWPVSVPAGTTFTHEADCLIEFTVDTLPSAGNIRVRFRHQDSSNFWYVLISSGGNFALYEIVEGGSTNRAVTVGSVANGHRVVIVADGTTIKGYSNNTLFWTYSNAENFATATAGEMNSLDTGGAVSDLKTWPRTLSGIAASVLNKASA